MNCWRWYCDEGTLQRYVDWWFIGCCYFNGFIFWWNGWSDINMMKVEYFVGKYGQGAIGSIESFQRYLLNVDAVCGKFERELRSLVSHQGQFSSAETMLFMDGISKVYELKYIIESRFEDTTFQERASVFVDANTLLYQLEYIYYTLEDYDK